MLFAIASCRLAGLRHCRADVAVGGRSARTSPAGQGLTATRANAGQREPAEAKQMQDMSSNAYVVAVDRRRVGVAVAQR